MFQLDHLDPGTYRLVASAEAGRVEHEHVLKPGERGKADLELQPWARLRGVVLDERTGAPIAGMSVMTLRDGPFQSGAGLDMLLGKGPRTDATCRFEMARVAPGAGKLRVVDRHGEHVEVTRGRFVLFILEWRDAATAEGPPPTATSPMDRPPRSGPDYSSSP